MTAARYNRGKRTEEEKAAGLTQKDGRITSNHLTNWFREISKSDPQYEVFYNKLCVLHSGIKPNKNIRIYLPK
ncbi:MAG TPA: hypothetical protein GX697_02460 [Firmicutes bacterium]|nr:hypothetical protein [Bacillota bacterium]